MTYVFDIDGTICTNTYGEYEKAMPIVERVKVVNALYEQGNTIIMQTARGMGRHNNDAEKAIKDLYDKTAAQLKEWGVKHHMLFLGKPAGDIYVDDRGIRDEDFFRNEFCP
tara:strand:+ start:2854 stop:3186 length:333 start_codon:yes stop_codon:yes gene_type:complete